MSEVAQSSKIATIVLTNSQLAGGFDHNFINGTMFQEIQ